MKTEKPKPRRGRTQDLARKKALSVKIAVMKSRSAFIRALPEISKQPEMIRQWVLYVGSQQIANAATKVELIKLCSDRGISLSRCYIGFVRCFGDSREEVESVDSPSLEYAY